MVALEIVEIRNNNFYILKEIKTNKLFGLFLEFYDIEKPKIGNTIIINKLLLNSSYEGFSQPYAFKLDKNKKINEFGEELEYIILNSFNKNYVLKRIYG